MSKIRTNISRLVAQAIAAWRVRRASAAGAQAMELTKAEAGLIHQWRQGGLAGLTLAVGGLVPTTPASKRVAT